MSNTNTPALPEPFAYYVDDKRNGREYNGLPLMSNGRKGNPLFTADQMRAALAAQAPGGVVLVPVEPTDEMLNAGKKVIHDSYSRSPREKSDRMYRAMLAAAPAAVAEPAGWLYDWTHSSALGKPDEDFTSFTKDRAYAERHQNARAVYLASQPAPVVAAEREPALTEAQAITLWHEDKEAHRRESAFEWYAAGILAGERAHGIGLQDKQPGAQP